MPGSVKDLTQTVIIPEESREIWLPLSDSRFSMLSAHMTIAGLSELTPGYSVTRIRLADHVLFYIINGSMKWQFGGSEGTAQAGQALLIPRDEPHKYWSEVCCTGCWLHLADTQFWISLRGRRPAVITTGRDGARIYMLLEMLIDERDERIIELCSSLVLMCAQRHTASESPFIKLQDSLECLWKTVDSCLSKQWTSQALAESISVSESTLVRAVSRVYGKSPMAKVEELRMRRAKELLRTRLYTLDLMSTLLGYSSQYALSRAFKRSVGVSPRTYIKQMKL